jgi:cytochrome c oxidase subunit 2
VAALSLIFAPSAFAGFLTPESGGSPQADNIDSLYKIALYVAAVVFVIVVGALLYSTYAFRAKKHPVAEQIHGNTRLEIGWTAGAAGILVILSIVTFVKLNGIVNPPNSDAGTAAVFSATLTAPNPPNGKRLTVCVQARQFFWRYVYGNGCNKKGWQNHLPYSDEEMEAPKGVTVDLLIQSSDVIHAWWIPKFGGKVDAVPGYTTYTWFKAERTGIFRGQCAQLCGRQHAFMTAQVRVVSPAQYTAWLSRQSQLIQSGNDQVGQLRQQLIQKGDLTSNGIF